MLCCLPSQHSLPQGRLPPKVERSLEACKGNVGGILQSNSCEGLALLSGEGFLCLQQSPQLCSARYLWWQIILNVLHGSQLLRQKSTTSSSCMLNSLHIQKGTKSPAYLPAGGVCACVFALVGVCVCVCVRRPPPPSSNRLC